MRELPRPRGPVLDVQYINGIAAYAGHALALLTPALFYTELTNGTLVQPFDYVHREEKALWLCYPKGREHWQKVKQFEQWLFAKLDETMPNRRGLEFISEADHCRICAIDRRETGGSPRAGAVLARQNTSYSGLSTWEKLISGPT